MCKICELTFVELDGLVTLIIKNCDKVTTIPQLNNLHTLSIQNCNNIVNIPELNNLNNLYINACNSIIKLSNLDLLFQLKIINSNIEISRINLYKLGSLVLLNCKNIYNFTIKINNESFISSLFKNKDEILKFIKINKIKHWYRRIKLRDQYYLIIEYLEKKRMHPNSKYFKKIINSFD